MPDLEWEDGDEAEGLRGLFGVPSKAKIDVVELGRASGPAGRPPSDRRARSGDFMGGLAGVLEGAVTECKASRGRALSGQESSDRERTIGMAYLSGRMLANAGVRLGPESAHGLAWAMGDFHALGAEAQKRALREAEGAILAWARPRGMEEEARAFLRLHGAA